MRSHPGANGCIDAARASPAAIARIPVTSRPPLRDRQALDPATSLLASPVRPLISPRVRSFFSITLKQSGRHKTAVTSLSGVSARWLLIGAMGPLVEALRGLRGLDFISSARFLAVGDLGRFENARAADVVSRPSAFGAVKRRTDLARRYHQDRQRRGTGECSSRPPGAIAIHRKLPRTRPRSSCGFPR